MEYVVTARHNIDEARSQGTLYIRFNLNDRPYIEVPTSPDDWLTHDSADVAAIPSRKSLSLTDHYGEHSVNPHLEATPTLY